MSAAKVVGAASALLGAVGTVVLFVASWSVEPPRYTPYAPLNYEEIKAGLERRNCMRVLFQRIGLSSLLASFLLQGFAVFL